MKINQTMDGIQCVLLHTEALMAAGGEGFWYQICGFMKSVRLIWETFHLARQVKFHLLYLNSAPN